MRRAHLFLLDEAEPIFTTWYLHRKHIFTGCPHYPFHTLTEHFEYLNKKENVIQGGDSNGQYLKTEKS
jgi:hypothetical protein